jgi:phage-related protein
MKCGAKVVKLGNQWTVYALSEGRGEKCPVFDFLSELDGKTFRIIMSLFERVGEYGPFRGPDISKPLGDGLFELRPGPFRVVYFYDAGRMVLCTHIFRKTSPKTKRTELEEAHRWKNRYFAAKKANSVEFYT